jgi:hypothetical protein
MRHSAGAMRLSAGLSECFRALHFKVDFYRRSVFEELLRRGTPCSVHHGTGFLASHFRAIFGGNLTIFGAFQADFSGEKG